MGGNLRCSYSHSFLFQHSSPLKCTACLLDQWIDPPGENSYRSLDRCNTRVQKDLGCLPRGIPDMITLDTLKKVRRRGVVRQGEGIGRYRDTEGGTLVH